MKFKPIIVGVGRFYAKFLLARFVIEHFFLSSDFFMLHFLVLRDLNCSYSRTKSVAKTKAIV